MIKGILNKTQMADKLVEMVHILLTKALRRNTVFVMKLIILLQQLVQEEQQYSVFCPQKIC